MKLIAVLFFLFSFSLPTFSQQNTARLKVGSASIVSFITVFNKNNATKDGYYINGYVVNISRNKARQLNHKKIRVTGKVSIEKGLNNEPKLYDKNGEEIIRQGRANDTKHILIPSIRILQN